MVRRYIDAELFIPALLPSPVLGTSHDTDAGSPVAPLADRYVLERELGRGGMAVVYLAHDQRHDAPVAVKVVRRELGALLSSERFAREVRITARLQHPHILPVLDSGVANGVPFYTMPYVAGESLGERVGRERQLPIDDAVRIARQLADALAYAHLQGVVHRDIKPSNVLLAGYPPQTGVTSEWYAMLADFGIARAMDATGAEKITDSGLAIGTAPYMSPEQGSGDRVDGRSDIYALGCVLYEMLAGTPPFTGATPQAVLARHAVDPVPSLRTVRATVSPALDAVVTKALAKTPADRFADAAAMRDALVAASKEPATTREIAAFSMRRWRWPVAAAAIAITLATVFASGKRQGLDARRVTVFPLAISGDTAGMSTAGEDVATLIGNSLDGVGPVRWIDGARFLDAAPDASRARAAALARQSAYYVTGRILHRGDSADVLVDLYATAGDSAVAHGRATGGAKDVWRVGLRAVNGLLPALLGGSVPRDFGVAWTSRDPSAVTHFLLGEADFRRARARDALVHYREAVAADSAFAIAALRGAQAAAWFHESHEATALLRVALGRPLSTRDRHFALGSVAFVEGRADSAIAEFRRALVADSDMTVAWMQLGEAYTHLLPVALAVPPDSLADLAFAQARRRDSSATQALLHPIESLLRRGRADEAAPLLRRFLAARPDSTITAQLTLMDTCVRRGVGAIDWATAVRTNARAVIIAAQALGVAGRQPACAIAAYDAVLTHDTLHTNPRASDDRASALLGVVGLLAARGHADTALARVNASVARGDGGSSLLPLAAPVVPALATAAATIAQADAARFGANYERCPYVERSWILGSYAASLGRADIASAVAARLDAATRAEATPEQRLIARAAGAHALLARGDSTTARAAFVTLLAEPAEPTSLSWRPGAPRGAERLQYARLLLAHGEARRAREVADVFDSPQPAIYGLYLPASLALRERAATAMGDAAGAAAYHERLTALTTP